MNFNLTAYTQLLDNLDLQDDGLTCLTYAQNGHWTSWDLSQPADNFWEIRKFWMTLIRAWLCTKNTAENVIIRAAAAGKRKYRTAIFMCFFYFFSF